MIKRTKDPKKKKDGTSFVTDGHISERDFLIGISVGTFFLFVSVALIMILMGKTVDPMYLSLLDMVSPVVMVVVGAIFSTNVAEIVANRPKREVKTNTVVIESKPIVEEITEEEDIL